MKKILLTVLAFVFMGAIAHAQTPAADASKAKSLATLIERSSGKLESLQKAEPSKGDFGSFTVLDKEGKKKDFILIAKTKIYGLNSVPSSFDQLKKGDSLLVLYVVTLKGLNEAISISETR